MKHLRSDCNASHIAIGGACFNCGAKPEPQDRRAPIFTPAAVALLEQLVTTAGARQVDIRICLNDHDHTWYLAVDSAAPAERFVGKGRSQLESAVEDALGWLDPATRGTFCKTHHIRLQRETIPCPDNRVGCCVRHFRLICPQCSAKGK